MSRWPEYRKKIGVEAVEITEEFLAAVRAEEPEWLVFVDGPNIGVETKRDVQVGWVGDYLVRSFDGEVYPCPRDTFLATYEAVTYPDLLER